MTKELEALNTLKNITIINFEDENGVKRIVFASEVYKEPIQIIETALKNYEELTSKPVILYGRTHGQTQALIDTICKNYKEVKITNLDDEKKLKALGLLDDCDIDIWLLKHCDYENYCRIRRLCLEATGNADKCSDCDKEVINLPTEEEFNELKEVLL